jgi:pilus assembly protein CpaF
MADPMPGTGKQGRPFLDDMLASPQPVRGLPSAPPEPASDNPTTGSLHLFAAATGTMPAAAADSHELDVVQRPATTPPQVSVRGSVDEVDWRIVDSIVKELSLDSAGQRSRADFDVATASAGPETPFETETLNEIRRLVQHHTDYQTLNDGPDNAWGPELTARHVQAVFDSAFRYGRFQTYLREESVEDISIVGHDNVMITTSTGLHETRPPIADSDLELERMVADLASWRGRAFGRPNGHIDLDIGGARFSATGASITSVPNVTLRKHNHVDVTLDDMVTLGTITNKMAKFLTIASQANLSALVAGYPQVGKTTFLRAWMSAVPWEEKIVTIETERELYLNKLPHRHAQVSDFQYLPSTLAGSDLTSTYSLEDAFRESLRSSAQRILFGEIRGAEGPVALKAMQAGKGSISTIHARNPTDALHRFADILMSEQGLTDDMVPLRQILRSIDLVVYLDIIPNEDGTRRRVVTEIAEVIARPTEQLPMASPLFRWDHLRGVQTQPEKPSVQLMERFSRYGLDADLFAEVN